MSRVLKRKPCRKKVEAQYTSQRCVKCGRINKDNRNHGLHLYKLKVYGKGIDTDIYAGDSTVYMLANPVDGYWKKIGTTMCIWQNTSAQLTLYANWIPNTYTVSIPTSVSYSGMKVGKVNTSDFYDVIVKNKTGSFGDTVAVQASNGVLSAENGSTEKLNVTAGSASSALTFTANEAKKDNVAITGTTRTADKWTGLIQYTVSIK